MPPKSSAVLRHMLPREARRTKRSASTSPTATPKREKKELSTIAMKTIVVNDKMQQGYTYTLSAPMGERFHPDFKPGLTPKQMLELGVFGGKYMTDCKSEFPSDWFTKAKLSPEKKNIALNYYQVDASMPLKEWQDKGWLHPDDPRGWFQWYCRYYYGRRNPEEDTRQVKRWKQIARHVGQIRKNCPGDQTGRVRQRQALLHWAYDARTL